MKVALRQPRTGDCKFVGTGWSWRIFFGAAFLGLPLFFRGLALWGTAMMVLWIVELSAPFVASANGEIAAAALGLIGTGLSVYLGFRGNALAARHLIACGYEFAEPKSGDARAAALRWGI